MSLMGSFTIINRVSYRELVLFPFSLFFFVQETMTRNFDMSFTRFFVYSLALKKKKEPLREGLVRISRPD